MPTELHHCGQKQHGCRCTVNADKCRLNNGTNNEFSGPQWLRPSLLIITRHCWNDQMLHSSSNNPGSHSFWWFARKHFYLSSGRICHTFFRNGHKTNRNTNNQTRNPTTAIVYKKQKFDVLGGFTMANLQPSAFSGETSMFVPVAQTTCVFIYRYMMKFPYIDRTRIAVFGKVRPCCCQYSHCKLTKPESFTSFSI